MQDFKVLQTNGSGVLSFATPSSGTNTPAWNAHKSATQSLVGDVATKITFNTETLDTDNAFASSTFTVPTGKGGSYFYYCLVNQTYATDRVMALRLFKNGSIIHQLESNALFKGILMSGIITLVATDTLEMFYIIFENPVSGVFNAGEDDTKFGGFRILT